jgi:hypothetical protein
MKMENQVASNVFAMHIDLLILDILPNDES